MIRTITLALFSGVLILHHLPRLPPEELLLVLPLAVVTLFFTKSFLLRFFVFCLIGFLWAQLQAVWLLDNKLPSAWVGKDIIIEGYIASLPERSERKTRFEFDVLQPESVAKVVLPKKIILSVYQVQKKQFVPGDKWRFNVRLKPPYDFANPGSFPYRKWLLQRGILATGYVRNTPEAELLYSSFISYPVQRLRYQIQTRLNKLAIDQTVIPFVRTLLIGDRSGLTDHHWKVLQKTGTVHLMAISGLHVGLIAAVVFFITRIAWSYLPFVPKFIAASRAAALNAWLAAFLYSALAGFALPTQRALIMLSVILLALAINKRIKPTKILSIALLLILLFDSFAVLSASFWLSFAAVGIIYYFLLTYSQVRNSGYSDRFKSWFYLQIVISMGLLPLTILFFQQAPVLSPLMNMVAIPVVGFIVVPLCLLAGLLLFVHAGSAEFILDIVVSIFSILWQGLEWSSSLSFSSHSFATPSWYVLLLAVIGLLLFFLPKVFYVRLLALICCIPILLSAHERPLPGDFKLTVLDVGQGLSVVVQTAEHSLVYDTGPRFSRSFDTGRAVVLPYLRESGIDQVDKLLISHGDNDHIGGAESILTSMRINEVSTSVPSALKTKKGIELTRCRYGQAWQWDGVDFAILHPYQDDYKKGLSENDLSCVLIVTSKDRKALLTGDIEKTAESLLLQRHSDLYDFDLIVVPHHGSKTSSTAAFVERIEPEIAIFPAGWRNRFKFPHSDVLARYRSINTHIYLTSESGAISYSSDTGYITEYRKLNRSRWND